MNTSQKHWLEPVLSRELAAVEAPASLRVAVLYARHEGRITSRKFMWAGAALAAGVFGVVFGVVIHTQSFTERGSAANTINLFSQNTQVRAGIKAVQFSGACHLCHSDL